MGRDKINAKNIPVCISLLEQTAPLSQLLALSAVYLSVCITADRAGGERLKECFLRKTNGCAVPSQSDILYILWINPIHTHTWRVAQSLLPLVRPGGGGGGHIPNLLSPDSATRKIFATNGSPPTRSTHRLVCVQGVGGTRPGTTWVVLGGGGEVASGLENRGGVISHLPNGT